MAPWRLLLWIKWCVMWVFNYWILRQAYSLEDQTYLTKKALEMNERNWSVNID